jgi:hypothetical protein
MTKPLPFNKGIRYLCHTTPNSVPSIGNLLQIELPFSYQGFT